MKSILLLSMLANCVLCAKST